MKELVPPSQSDVASVVGDLQRIAQRLMALSEDCVARGMTHTNGVDCLIGFVDRMDYACALAEEKNSGHSGSARAAAKVQEESGDPSDPMVGELPDLCQDIRCKAANLDRLNRDGVAAASEVGELAADLMRVEGELRRWLSPTTETPAA